MDLIERLDALALQMEERSKFATIRADGKVILNPDMEYAKKWLNEINEIRAEVVGLLFSPPPGFPDTAPAPELPPVLVHSPAPVPVSGTVLNSQEETLEFTLSPMELSVYTDSYDLQYLELKLGHRLMYNFLPNPLNDTDGVEISLRMPVNEYRAKFCQNILPKAKDIKVILKQVEE